MKKINSKYDSDNELVTIRADDKEIGELREIKVDYVALVIKRIQEMYRQMFN